MIEHAETGKKRRHTLVFEPSGPVRAMVELELKKMGRAKANRPHGALRKVLEGCVVDALGSKYPKLFERYQVLKEEGAA